MLDLTRDTFRWKAPMRTALSRLVTIALVTLAAAVLACPAQADPRTACITACEATAQTCMGASHAKYDACKPAANKQCANTVAAEKFKCLTTALRACNTNHSAELEPCRTTFDTCYAACGPHPADTTNFWCALNADSVATSVTTRKDVFCAGTPGLTPADQLESCVKRHTPTDPAMGFSLDCEPLG
ncbi:hypothetical protein [Hyphomicrobium sp. LHD-15]|uniref:hypothetical protein n=1 Tax=Hyphomicrobium sp. LHD-15 TaxID=3072142 RepID=UPI00280F3F8B|nr:hypothetical protein [Hyphomicrobium sp. LHD-15]MDQ8700736.1 hypothetical protein [Hyphomicrobium sp. LHD-15]